MKKLRIFLCLMLALVVGAVSAACGSNPVTPNIPPDPGTTPGNNKPAYSYTSPISVYMPDGAPALGLAKLMNDDNKLGKTDLTYTVVTASAIGDYVRDKSATVAVMPVNAASLLCGKGDAYKMAAVLTHGNLFVIGKGEAAKLEDLKGSVVEVVNINNVPGLTFMSLLKGANIDYVVRACRFQRHQKDGRKCEHESANAVERRGRQVRLSASRTYGEERPSPRRSVYDRAVLRARGVRRMGENQRRGCGDCRRQSLHRGQSDLAQRRGAHRSRRNGLQYPRAKVRRREVAGKRLHRQNPHD